MGPSETHEHKYKYKCLEDLTTIIQCVVRTLTHYFCVDQEQDQVLHTAPASSAYQAALSLESMKQGTGLDFM